VGELGLCGSEWLDGRTVVVWWYTLALNAYGMILTHNIFLLSEIAACRFIIIVSGNEKSFEPE